LARRIFVQRQGHLLDQVDPFLPAAVQIGDHQVILAAELAIEHVLAAAALIDDLLQPHPVRAVLLE
jgi:hypothetical protein